MCESFELFELLELIWIIWIIWIWKIGTQFTWIIQSCVYLQTLLHTLDQLPFELSTICLTVIDDENPTVYTANAIVTVTVLLTRKDMRHLFGDETVKEQTSIDEEQQNGDAEAGIEPAEEQIPAVKRPAWLKQKKGAKKSSKKRTNKKPLPAKAPAATTLKASVNQQEETPKVKKKEDKEEKEKSEQESTKEKVSPGDESEAESDRSEEEESSNDKKDTTFEDDDSEWEKSVKKSHQTVNFLLFLFYRSNIT